MVVFFQIKLLLQRDLRKHVRAIPTTIYEVLIPCLFPLMYIVTHFASSTTSEPLHTIQLYMDSVFKISFSFGLAIVINASSLVGAIISERESHMKEYMKIMGMKGVAHKIVTCITAFSKMTLVLVLITFYQKLSFKDSNVVLMLLINILIIVYTILFAFLISTLIKSATFGVSVISAISLAFLIWNIIVIFLTQTKAKMGGVDIEWYEYFNIQAIFTRFLYAMANLELNDGGMSFSNLFSPFSKSPAFYMLVIIGECFVLVIGEWYIDAVLARGDGIALKWNFLFTADYWGRGKDRSDNENDGGLESDECLYKEEINIKSEPMIKIQSLWKTYENNIIHNVVGEDSRNYVVKNLNLNIYQNTIMALLGKNGVGKSTTINVLTGIHSQTKGNVFINGLDTKTRMNDIRRDLGFCPQHNVLFDYLTCIEHLQFFCSLKGQVFDKDEAIELLEKFQMGNKRKVRSDKLSGGQKRKLSLAIALIGSSKIVILDEPSAGVDVHSCREIWNLLLAEKKHRTILITTHYLEEADILSDQISILVGGKVMCVGSPLYLKKKFGDGYHLSVQFNDNDDKDAVDRNIKDTLTLLKRHCPEGRILSHFGPQAKYVLPDKNRSDFPKMIEEFEKQQIVLDVASYGFSINTMDDVFIKVSKMNSDGSSNVEDSDEYEGGKFGAIIEKIKGSERNSGISLFFNQFLALQVKHLEFMLKKSLTFASFILLPTAFVCGLLYYCYTKSIEKNKGMDNMANNTSETSPFIYTSYSYNQRTEAFLAWAMLFPIACTIMMIAFIIIPMTENINKFKHLQFMAGTKLWVYWLAIFVFSMTVYLCSCAIMITTFYIFLSKFGDNINSICYRYAAALFLFGWSGLPFIFIFTFMFKNFDRGLIVILIITNFISPVKAIVTSLLNSVLITETDPAVILKQNGASTLKVAIEYIVAFIFPIVNLNNVLAKEYGPQIYLDATKVIYNDVICFIIFGVQAIMFWIIIFLIEDKKLKCSIFGRKKGERRGAVADAEDEDVIKESEHMSICESNSYPIVVKNLKKSYGVFEAVRGVSFHVNTKHIFGLIGLNGAGKSSVFNILTGQTEITEGDAFINDKKVSAIRSGATRVGYCPQFDTITPELTGKTILYLFARLNGHSNAYIKIFVDSVLDILDLRIYANKSVKTYSGGCKRRLSLGISIIGVPDILLLDEPTAGVDPGAKRLIWDVLRIFQKNNTAVILTSHHIEEIDLLCTNIAIMMLGKFRCYGSPLHIKDKYGSGYSVTFKLTPQSDAKEIIEQFLSKFRNSRIVIEEVHQISFEIPKNESVSWSNLFQLGEEYLEKYRLDDYSLGQTTLEQIFNDFSMNESSATGIQIAIN